MVTAVWGWTFVLVKDAITQYPVLPFLELRFLLAALVMAVVVHRLPSRRELSLGVVAGTVRGAVEHRRHPFAHSTPFGAGVVGNRDHGRVRIGGCFLHPDLGAGAPRRKPHRAHLRDRAGLGIGGIDRAGGPAPECLARGGRRAGARRNRRPRARPSDRPPAKKK